MELTAEEEEKRIGKYLTPERIKMIEKEELEDLQAIEDENPPLPEEEAPPIQKKARFIAGDEI